MNWERNIPGTDVDRLAFITLVRRCYEDGQVYGIIDPMRLAELTRCRVLTVRQLATVYGMGRQSMYQRIWKAQLDLPEHTVQGNINPKALDSMEVAVKMLVLGKSVPYDLQSQCRYGTSPKLLEHITGIPIGVLL